MDDASPGDFATLLATQLESQRMYFETLLNKIENTHGSELSFLLDKVDALALAQKDLEPLRKDRKVMEKRVDKLLKRVEVLEKDLADEVAMNQSLLVDQKSLSAQIDVKDRLIACKDQELEDLKEQVRDLMFYLETMEKTKDTDLAGASFVATSAEKRPKGKKR